MEPTKKRDGRGKGGGRPKHRTKEQRASDLNEMAELRLNGWNRAQLARHFGINPSSVDLDLRQIRKDYERERNETIDQYRDIARLREFQIRKLALEEFYKSKIKEIVCRYCDDDTQENCMVCQGQGRIKVEVPGNPTFLRIVHDCDEALRAIDGVDLEQKTLPSMVQVFNFDQVIKEQEKKAKELGETFVVPNKVELELQRRIEEMAKKDAKEQKKAEQAVEYLEDKPLPNGFKELENGS